MKKYQVGGIPPQPRSQDAIANDKMIMMNEMRRSSEPIQQVIAGNPISAANMSSLSPDAVKYLKSAKRSNNPNMIYRAPASTEKEIRNSGVSTLSPYKKGGSVKSKKK